MSRMMWMYSLWRHQCSSSVSPGCLFVWIARSSMYTESHPCATCLRNMVFIIIWKVAGEFVRPKNMTVGSKRPSGVRNATFHSSPGFMRMLLYPHRMSNLVNSVHPLRRSMVWGIRGETLRFLFVHLFIGQ